MEVERDLLSSSQERFYVYTHHDTSTGEIFYVGKGTGRRAWNKSSRTSEWKSRSGCDMIVHIIFDGLSDELALFIERMLINKIGIENLENKTMGGGGALGYKHTDEWKEKLSTRMAGDLNPMKGMTGERNPFYGKNHNEQTKRKMKGPRPGVSGRKNPSADLNVYTFVHDRHGEFSGDRASLREMFNLTTSQTSKIFSRGACAGWRVKDG